MAACALPTPLPLEPSRHQQGGQAARRRAIRVQPGDPWMSTPAPPQLQEGDARRTVSYREGHAQRRHRRRQRGDGDAAAIELNGSAATRPHSPAKPCPGPFQRGRAAARRAQHGPVPGRLRPTGRARQDGTTGATRGVADGLEREGCRRRSWLERAASQESLTIGICSNGKLLPSVVRRPCVEVGRVALLR